MSVSIIYDTYHLCSEDMYARACRVLPSKWFIWPVWEDKKKKKNKRTDEHWKTHSRCQLTHSASSRLPADVQRRRRQGKRQQRWPVSFIWGGICASISNVDKATFSCCYQILVSKFFFGFLFLAYWAVWLTGQHQALLAIIIWCIAQYIWQLIALVWWENIFCYFLVLGMMLPLLRFAISNWPTLSLGLRSVKWHTQI